MMIDVQSASSAYVETNRMTVKVLLRYYNLGLDLLALTLRFLRFSGNCLSPPYRYLHYSMSTAIVDHKA